MGARDPRRAEDAAARLLAEGLDVSTLAIDVTDHGSVESAAKTIAQTHGKLDVLMNNAGIVDEADGPPTSTSPEAARRIMETNFIGTIAVTQAMLPLLRNSPAGRIVNLSSALGSLSQNGNPSSPYYSARLLGYNAQVAQNR